MQERVKAKLRSSDKKIDRIVDFSAVIKDNACAQPMILQMLVTSRNVDDKLWKIRLLGRLISSATKV